MIVGFGSIGRRHFDNLGRLGVSRRTVVRRPAGRNPAFEPPAGAAIVEDHAAALAAKPDLAILCNPTSFHVAAALEYVRAGVPVLVEKPLSDEPVEARRLVAEARRRQVHGATAFCLRHHPAYARARAIVQAGGIGRVLYAKAWFEAWLPAWHPWEDYRSSYAARSDLGGGALRTLDHELDFLNWCLGAPEAVAGYAARSGRLESSADDHAAILLRYPGGVFANVQLALCRADHARGFELVGTTGTLRFRWAQPILERSDGRSPCETQLDCSGYEVNDMYLATLAAFLDDLTTGSQTSATLEAGLLTVETCAEVLRHGLVAMTPFTSTLEERNAS